MADKKIVNEREYVIPLRRELMKVPKYRRAGKSVRAIREYIAKHMKVPDRDVNKIKLDIYLNQELWFRGCKKPPIKIKVKAIRDGDIVRVELIDIPEKLRFLKARQEKLHKKVDKKAKKEEEKKPETADEKKEAAEDKKKKEEKKEVEKEKAASVEKAQEKIMERAAKAQKHTVKGKGPQIQRKALKK